MIYKFFDKMSTDSGVNTHANKPAFNNERFAEELDKPIIRKFKKRTGFILDLKTILGCLFSWYAINNTV